MKNLLILSMFLLSSCATVLGSKNQNVSLVTEDGENLEATVTTIKGTKKVSLPGSIVVSRNERHITIKVNETSCYKKTVVHVDPQDVRTINPWFWGNVISSSWWGLVTDYATGAMWKYQDTIVIEADKKNSCR